MEIQEHCNAWVALPAVFRGTSPMWSRGTIAYLIVRRRLTGYPCNQSQFIYSRPAGPWLSGLAGFNLPGHCPTWKTYTGQWPAFLDCCTLRGAHTFVSLTSPRQPTPAARRSWFSAPSRRVDEVRRNRKLLEALTGRTEWNAADLLPVFHWKRKKFRFGKLIPPSPSRAFYSTSSSTSFSYILCPLFPSSVSYFCSYIFIYLL